jgi:hypothetical protein
MRPRSFDNAATETFDSFSSPAPGIVLSISYPSVRASLLVCARPPAQQSKAYQAQT